jgi:hypothetical protein
MKILSAPEYSSVLTVCQIFSILIMISIIQ